MNCKYHIEWRVYGDPKNLFTLTIHNTQHQNIHVPKSLTTNIHIFTKATKMYNILFVGALGPYVDPGASKFRAETPHHRGDIHTRQILTTQCEDAP